MRDLRDQNSDSMTRSRFQALLEGSGGSSTQMSTAEDQRAFFQKRLGLFAKVACLFVAAFYLLSNGAMLATGERSFGDLLGDWINRVALLNLVATGLVWWVCVRHHPLAFSVLRAIDAITVVLMCVVFTAFTWSTPEQPHHLLAMNTAVLFAVLLRAVVIPSSTTRTAIVSALGYAPYVVTGVVNLSKPDLFWPEEWDPISLPMLITRSVLGVGIAAVVSAVIYGLQRQVRRARELGQYRLEEKIGEGGMGQVFRARHAMLRRPTAIKLLKEDMAGEDAILRFEREVQLTSQLTHPNTIAIFDYGRTPEGMFYYAMEFLDGLHLEEVIEIGGPLPPARVIHILRQVCGSLSEAHQHGMIHRDIKPANIILCERGKHFDVAKVVDFGLVKNLDASGDVAISSATTITGTPLYMSPETIRTPGEVDARSDLYSVGVVGYYLLSGERVFDTENVMEICSKHLTEVPVLPSTRTESTIPDDLEKIIMSCLEKDPADRPQDAGKLEAALASCIDANSWSQADARSWWDAHEDTVAARFGVGPSVSEETSDISQSQAGALPSPTVTINFETRVQ